MTAPDDSAPVSLRHRVEFAGYRAATSLLHRLGPAGAERLGGALGRLAGGAVRLRRGVVVANVGRAFPELAPEARARIVRESYAHLGREALATFRMGALSPEDVRARTRVEGLERLEALRAAGRPVLVVTGHLGNWEIGGAALAARGVPVDAVALRQRNRLFDRDLVENRAQLGMRVIDRDRAPREVLRSLRRGRVPALVADQNPARGGIVVDFFGLPAPTARGPAVLALRADAALVLGVALRVRDQSWDWSVHLEEIEVERTGDPEADVRRLTQAHTSALEAWVRRAPEQYFWVHKRWKRRPDAERAVPAEVPPTP